MALSEDEDKVYQRLYNKLVQERRELDRLDDYYEGVQQMRVLGLAVPPEMDEFTTIINWPRVTVDSIAERCILDGFQMRSSNERYDELDLVLQSNNMDSKSQIANVESLVMRRSFIAAGSGAATDHNPFRAADTPVVTAESPREMTVELDPRDGEVVAALKYYDRTEDGVLTKYSTLYLPNVTIWQESNGRGEMVEVDRDEHNLGAVMVSPIVTRPRLEYPRCLGVSEIHDVIPVTDAAVRTLTNLQFATETMAVPKWYALGAKESDFVDPKTGKQKPKWATYMASFLTLMNENAKIGQLVAANLSNFTGVTEHYAKQLASLKGLPMRYLGTVVNPPSGDGIRADESRLIKLCESRTQVWGDGYVRSARCIRRLLDGDWDPKLAQLKADWRDPATPTRAQQADAAVKLVQANIIPIEAAWDEMGYSATKKARLKEQMKQQRLDAIDDPILAKFLAPNEAQSEVRINPPADGTESQRGELVTAGAAGS